MTDPVADAEPVSVAELAPPQMSISEAAGPAVVGATSGDMEVLALADAVADVGMFNGMSLDARMEQILSVGQECVNEDGLRALLTKKPTRAVWPDAHCAGRDEGNKRQQTDFCRLHLHILGRRLVCQAQ
jgi:hypothetical protein